MPLIASISNKDLTTARSTCSYVGARGVRLTINNLPDLTDFSLKFLATFNDENFR